MDRGEHLLKKAFDLLYQMQKNNKKPARFRMNGNNLDKIRATMPTNMFFSALDLTKENRVPTLFGIPMEIDDEIDDIEID